MSKFNGSYRREQLAPMMNQKVHCIGEFAGVNIKKNETSDMITILFHNVTIANDVTCDHVWVFYNRNFNHLNIKLGCIMEFDAVVQKYKHEDRLGISDCSNIRIISDNVQTDEKISLKVNTIKYDNTLRIIPKIPAHINLMREYGIKSGTRIDVTYDENKNNNRKDKIFLAVYLNGQKVYIKGEVFFDPSNKHGIMLGKYFIPVKESICRNLSLMYFRQQFCCAA